MQTKTLHVKDIHCKSCESLIIDTLKDIGVKEMSFKGSNLTITFDEIKTPFKKIKETIEKEGHKVK